MKKAEFVVGWMLAKRACRLQRRKVLMDLVFWSGQRGTTWRDSNAEGLAGRAQDEGWQCGVLSGSNGGVWRGIVLLLCVLLLWNSEMPIDAMLTRPSTILLK